MSKPLTCPDGHAMDEGYIECPACGKRREEPMTYDCPSCGLDIDAAGHTADCPPAAEVYRMRGWRLINVPQEADRG